MLGLLAVFWGVGIYFTGHHFHARFSASEQVEATEGKIKKYPIPTSEDLSRSLAAELGKVSESESVRRAFNKLAGLWKVPPIPESAESKQFDRMEQAARDRDLNLFRFSGNLNALLRFNSPVALELTMPELPGKRFLSLVSMENEQLLVDPPIAGKRSLSSKELEKHWSGQGFLLWKDPLNLLTKVSPGSKGGPIRQLQGLLREAGAYRRSLTGVYDRDTLSAVRSFQSSRGIEQDGIVGDQTLMLLYRSIDRFPAPRLMVAPK